MKREAGREVEVFRLLTHDSGGDGDEKHYTEDVLIRKDHPGRAILIPNK